MKGIPLPIFKNNLSHISWKKIYDREYGVQYSEVAVSLLAHAGYHFSHTSVAQVVIPGEGSSTAFYIDGTSWVKLVEALNNKYTTNVEKLEEYEKQFYYDGQEYIKIAKKIALSDLKQLSNKELLAIFLTHQDKRNRYSVFAWSAFILNNYVADRATKILEPYIKKHKKEDRKQEIIDALFSPEKRAAILQLQYEVENKGQLAQKQFNDLYERFKWLTCLDIHNKPWTKEEFKKHIASFVKSSRQKQIPFTKVVAELKLNKKDLEYLLMAKRFVYIKDARDDYRRESVFYSHNLFKELGRRMDISSQDVSYLQEEEIINFLNNQINISKQKITDRKKGFVIYLDIHNKLICLQGDQVKPVVTMLDLLPQEAKIQNIAGRIACVGVAKGVVVIVRGVGDLHKVKEGNILVSVTTHPDYVPAMRKAVAIVTDEGGITSHAAIVAREFGIPCIVGTKSATKLLKDGDLVEVDANKGVVRKIS